MVKEKHFDKFAKNYDFYTKILMLGTYEKVRKKILSTENEKDEIALDLCCGTGYIGGHLKAMKVVGLDLSLGMLEINRQKNKNALLIKGDAFNLPFRHEEFDSVYCTLATHEFKNIAPILKEAHRVLKNNGRLIIFDVFKPNFLPTKFFVMVIVKYLAELGRMWVYTEEEWKKLLRSIGFKSTDTEILYRTAILINAGK